MDKRCIARIQRKDGGIEKERGTGFLVGRDRLLTALHVVADVVGHLPGEPLRGHDGKDMVAHLVDGKRAGYLLDPKVEVRLGDPNNPPCWTLDGPVWIVDGLYDVQDDWAVLAFADALPADLVPCELATLREGKGLEWETWGFPEAAPNDGAPIKGEILEWNTRSAVLYGETSKDAPVAGISGAPCLVLGQAVALIGKAVLDKNGANVAGWLRAVHAPVIGERAGGGLAVEPMDPVPFQDDLIEKLTTPADSDDLRLVVNKRLKKAAEALKIGHKPYLTHVVRAMVGAGVKPAHAAITTLAAPADKHSLAIGWIAAAQLPAVECDKLAAASAMPMPSVVYSSGVETCKWYTARARHKLEEPPWGRRLLQVDVAGLEEGPHGSLQALLEHIAAQVTSLDPKKRSFWKGVLDGQSETPACIALHKETQIARAEALRAHLKTVLVLMVPPRDAQLPAADLDKVAAIIPHYPDEGSLLTAYEAALGTID